MKNKYTHIFFDLDHTLWDYNTNAKNVLNQIFLEYQLSKKLESSVEKFVEVFFQTNSALWRAFNQGETSKNEIRDQRFTRVLEHFGFDDPDFSKTLSHDFLFSCPRQSHVMQDADMILNYLSKKYHLSIITNGFDDVQAIKLKSSRLDKYFSHVFTSETIGVRKPSPEIFDYAIKQVKAEKSGALMIGDNPSTDILGARKAGITPLLYNPTGTTKSDCQLQIKHLSELMQLL